MFPGLKRAVPAVIAGVALIAVPMLALAETGRTELAQVQSQPLPPPAGTPQTAPTAPAPAPATMPPAPPPTKAEPRTPTPMTKPTPKPGQAAAPRTGCPDEKVDINAASADTLKKLPQIGGQRSSAIVKARPYAKPEDLVARKVLKKAVFEKIKPCITASGVAPSAGPSPRKGKPATKPAASVAPVPVPTAGQVGTKP